jgi:hypothetical protein
MSERMMRLSPWCRPRLRAPFAADGAEGFRALLAAAPLDRIELARSQDMVVWSISDVS